jgi:phosphoesterase RecJ-like protein
LCSVRTFADTPLFWPDMNPVADLKQWLAQPRRAVVVTHHKPDADALGSSLGLAGYLRKKGHKVSVFTPSDYPSFLAWMPGNDEVVIYDKERHQTISQTIANAEVIFCLDFSNLERIREMGEMVKKATAKKVMVDHHLMPHRFADVDYWDDGSASTAGLIFNLIRELGDESVIDAAIANCLYAGLMTDTGSFRHNNTTPEEFLIAHKLTLLGANPHQVAKNIYDTNSLERLRLTGFVLSQKLQVVSEYRTAYICLTADELRQFGSQTGDTEGLVNYGLSVEGVRLSVLMYDRKENIKLSFRSLDDFSVNDLARKHFEGGGHRNAAGGTSYLSLDETLKKFLSLLPQYKDDLTR